MAEKEIEKVEEIKEVETIEQTETVVEDKRQGLSIASFVLGIASIVLLKFFLIALTCGILAIVFGVKGKKRANKGLAAAGFIIGIIGVSLQAVLFLIGFILGLAMVGAAASLI